MCILLKLHYAKFDVSSLFCSKVIEEKPLGAADPPPVKKGLMSFKEKTACKDVYLLPLEVIARIRTLKFLFITSSQNGSLVI